MSDEYLPMPQHPKRKFQGEYVGIVETGAHDTLMRVQVRVKDIFTDDVPAADLPWATYRLPVGSRVNDGMFTPVKKGDYVWVDFPFGADTRRPRITGSVHYCPGEKPNFPDESHAPTGGGACIPLRTGLNDPVQRTEVDLNTLPCVFKQNGVCIEVSRDGTVRITNMNDAPDPSMGNKQCPGSNIEIDKYGRVVIHSVNSLFLSSLENLETAVHGDSDITILKDKTQSVHGDVTETTKGKHNISGTGGITITSDSKITIKAPMVEIN